MKSTHQRGNKPGRADSRRGSEKASATARGVKTDLHPAGQGGPKQQAGGPEHQGGDADEDRNP